jgi:glycosyltransferase involved in cell wall biosynthesis
LQVVIDDGSGESTAACIEQLRRATRLRLHHVWLPKQGFGKCRILNRAIMAASAEYLVFSDGDCIPRGDFLAQHVRLAAPGRFLSGGVVRLPRRVSERISLEDIIDGRATSAAWLTAQGWRPSRKIMLLFGRGRRGAWFDRLTPTRATFNGHNTSAWKDDILRVNGFDERMGYGGLDRELGERLINAGVRPMQIRHRAICVHLDHPRDYVDAAVVARNREIRSETRRRRHQWTFNGIDQEPDILRMPTSDSSPSHGAIDFKPRIRHAA